MSTGTISSVQMVFVQKLKRPSGSGIWGAYVLADDEFGIWLHTPAGSRYEGQDGEHVDVCEVAQDTNGAGRSIVQLIAPDAWWIATWYPPGTGLEVSVDICTPAALMDQTFTYTDLELDPWRDADGEVATDDWDEFQAARDRWPYQLRRSHRGDELPRVCWRVFFVNGQNRSGARERGDSPLRWNSPYLRSWQDRQAGKRSCRRAQPCSGRVVVVCGCGRPRRVGERGEGRAGRVELPLVVGWFVRVGFDELVMVTAEQGGVVECGAAAGPPGNDVVAFAGGGWFFTAGIATALVAGVEREPERTGDEAVVAADVDGCGWCRRGRRAGCWRRRQAGGLRRR